MKNILSAFIGLSVSVLLFSCAEKQQQQIPDISSDHIVVVSFNAPPVQLIHYTENDTLSKQTSSKGGYQTFTNAFEYTDEHLIIRKWTPAPAQNDTLIIEHAPNHLEMVTARPFSALVHSFLFKKGDTVHIHYENQLPIATIKNRTVNDTLLNLSKHRLEYLYQNTYTPHYLVLGELFLRPLHDLGREDERMIENYLKAKEAYEREVQWLHTLPFEGTELQYRLQALAVLMERHRQLPVIANWEVAGSGQLDKEPTNEKTPLFDFGKTDSLLYYSTFREHLHYVATYDVPKVKKSFPGGGSFYIDSRARFDSIAADERFGQEAKDYLLTAVYSKIVEDFSLNDKKAYFKKLEATVSNKAAIQHLKLSHNLRFELSEELLLLTTSGDTTTYAQLIDQHKGKWLYVDFWATTCKPCVEIKPHAEKLEKDLKGEPLVFIYLALNDIKERWLQSLPPDEPARKNFFVLNGNSSAVPEELNIHSIPHYLIYSPQGERVVDYANRPGSGAKEQLTELISAIK